MKNKKVKIIKIFLVIAIIGIVVSVAGILYTLKQYKDSQDTYEELKQYVAVETEDNKVPETEEGKDEAAEPMINVNLDVDTSSLKEINPDYLGWLMYEPLDISYPVVLDTGDSFYETHSFEMDESRAGGIFMDYLCKSNFDSFNTIIYGHNMRDGSMFGGLKKLVSNPEMIDENPYFYLFTEDYAMMYKIVCVYYAGSKSKTYDLMLEYTPEDKQAYIDYMDSVGTYKDEEFFNKEITDDLRLVTLSTCHGLNSSQRTVIQGELIAKEQR